MTLSEHLTTTMLKRTSKAITPTLPPSPLPLSSQSNAILTYVKSDSVIDNDRRISRLREESQTLGQHKGRNHQIVELVLRQTYRSRWIREDPLSETPLEDTSLLSSTEIILLEQQCI